MPVKFNYTTDNDRYAQCYRLMELLRLDFNDGKLTREKHKKLEDEVIVELLKYRTKIKNNAVIKATINDIALVR